jgi:hypothetical protein
MDGRDGREGGGRDEKLEWMGGMQKEEDGRWRKRKNGWKGWKGWEG